ncbi:MAG: CinA family protein [Treponema sp.]
MHLAIFQLIEALKERQALLVTAESLTGGMIAETVTTVPGVSQVFWGGWVTYSVESKVNMLAVPAAVIEHYGVVSCETAEWMATGALQAAKCERPLYAIAVTGIAGPDGGTAAVPVGTVCIACATNQTEKPLAVSGTYLFTGDRNGIRQKTVETALEMMLLLLDKTKMKKVE